jgi:hypothetical protein
MSSQSFDQALLLDGDMALDQEIELFADELDERLNAGTVSSSTCFSSASSAGSCASCSCCFSCLCSAA